MKNIFNKVSKILGAIIITVILLGMTSHVSAEVIVTHRIIANGVGYDVYTGASGGTQVGTTQSLISNAISLAVSDGVGEKVIQFGDGTTALPVPTVVTYNENNLASATYTGKVTSSGDNEYLLVVNSSAQVAFYDIEITNSSVYSSFGNRSKAIYINSTDSKLTVDGPNTLIKTVPIYSNGLFNNGGTVDIKNGLFTTDINGAHAVRNQAGTLNILGGIISATANMGYGVYNVSGVVNMTGGTVETTSATQSYAISNRQGTVNISGGNVNADSAGTQCIAVYQLGVGTINISGNAMLSSYANTINVYSGTINITGGTFKSESKNGSSITNRNGIINVNTNGKVISKSPKAIKSISTASDDTGKILLYGVTIWSKNSAEITVAGALKSSTGYNEISSINGDFGIDKATINLSYLVDGYQFDKWATTATRDTSVNNSAKQMVIGSDNNTFYLSILRNGPVIYSGQNIKQGGTLKLYSISDMENKKLQISKDGVAFTDLTYASGSSVVLPNVLEEGTYKLYLLQTDDITRSAGSASSFIVDNTEPSITAEELSRISNTNATVKFTSNEAGTYYYEIVEHGEDPPTMDTSVTEKACIIGENTVNLISLSSVTKGIYIRVKDKAGNLSNVLELDIAELPTGSVIMNNDTIKKNAEITLFSETGATIYYTTALNDSTPSEPTTSASTHISNGGTITLPELKYGDILKIKAIAVVLGKSDSVVADMTYTVQSKTELTLTGITLNNKEYNGNTDATGNFAGAGLNGIIGTDSVILKGTPSASFLTADVGNEKTVTVSGYSLEGVDAEYYTLNTTLIANITKKELILGVIVIDDKVYDGTNDAIVTSIPISTGIVGSDDVSVNVAVAVSTYDGYANVATGAAVTISNIQLIGEDSANYSISSIGTATGNIKARTVTVDSIVIANKSYDGNTTATITGATLTGKVNGDDVTIDYSTTPAVATFEDALVGNEKHVSVEGLTLGGSDKANYILSSDNYITTGSIVNIGTVTTPIADIADNAIIKSGASVKLMTAGNDGAALYYTMGLAPENPTIDDDYINSGGTVTITGNPGDKVILKVYGVEVGYEDSSTTMLSYIIQPKRTLSVTESSAASKIYDGATASKVTGGTLEGDIIAGDEVKLDASKAVGQFSDKNVGTNKIVTVSGYTLDGSDALYYDLKQPILTANILNKSVEVSSIVISDKVYDGSKAATVESIVLSWKANGDDVYAQVTTASAVFADANIGNSKSVNITGIKLMGVDAKNYQLSTSTFTSIGNIVPAGTVMTPTVNPVEERILSDTNITLATTTSGAAIYYTTDGSTPTKSSIKYTGPISITGNSGDVVIVKAIAEKAGMIDSGILTKQYTIDEPGTLIITTEPDDQTIKLRWTVIPDAVTYAVYKGDNYLGNGAFVTDSVFGYNVNGLTNGNLYTFTVKALDSEHRVTNTAQVSAIPRTVPVAPTDVTAIAGKGQAIISFTAPTDNGGSGITGYIVTSNPGNIIANGIDSPITITGLTNGINYTFTVKAVNIVGYGIESSASNGVTPHKSSSRSTSKETGVEVLVNGKKEIAATENIKKVEDRIVTTIILDDKKIEEKLQNEENNSVVTISPTNEAKVVDCQLNGQTVKNMEIKEAVLQIKTEGVIYTLPASEINIDNVSAELGGQVELKDIRIKISVEEPLEDIAKIVEDTANNNNYQIVAKPIEFKISCLNGEKTVEVSKFKRYIERTIAIPKGIEPSRITTGVVLNEDGTFSHVPTQIVEIDGKYYAKINSLTNSIYSVIYNSVEFEDVDNHWAKNAVNDMGSRMVISGIGDVKFEPDRDITRAEFAAIMIKALGLKPGMGDKDNPFSDVKESEWYSGYIKTAHEYKLISGIDENNFAPTAQITREQAMTMIARAMNITGLKVEFEAGEVEKLLDSFTDSFNTSDYAKTYIATCIKTGIASGKGDRNIDTNDNITRAEVAVMIQRLLKKSNLI